MAEAVNEFDVTIAGGVLDLSQGTGIYWIETEGGASADSISSVTGAAWPHVYELHVKTSGHWWTIDHNPAGGLYLFYGNGFVTANVKDYMVVRANKTGSGVFEFWRAIIPST